MSTTRLLLTGASGYIGGTFLKYLLLDAGLSSKLQVFALVRNEAHVEIVKGMGVTAVHADMMDEEALTKVVLDNEITIVIHMATCHYFEPARALLRGLASLKQKTGKDVHFVATSGAKAFSSQAGIPVEEEGVISDRGAVWELQNKYKAIFPLLQQHVDVNNSIQKLGEELNVKTYIVVPPMVYGPGEGFGNKISVQYVALVGIAAKSGKLFHIEEISASWPLMHVIDMSSLYISMIHAFLSSKDIPHNKPSPPLPQGYYFGENGNFNWYDLSVAIVKVLNAAGLVKDSDAVVRKATDQDIEDMGKAMGYPGPMISWAISGRCAIKGENARIELGWEPKYGLDHLMSTVGEETTWILTHLKDEKRKIPTAKSETK